MPLVDRRTSTGTSGPRTGHLHRGLPHTQSAAFWFLCVFSRPGRAALRDGHTYRSVLGAIDGTAALGRWSGGTAAQEDNWPTSTEWADYWEVAPGSTETAVTEPTRGVSPDGDVLLGVDVLRAQAAYESGGLLTSGELPIGEGVFTETDVPSGADGNAGPLTVFGEGVVVDGGTSAARIDQGRRADIFDDPDGRR